MSGTLADFESFRARMNDLILGAGNLTINRFFALDRTAYESGALGAKTKEMLGLVSSLVLRCDLAQPRPAVTPGPAAAAPASRGRARAARRPG